MSKQEVEIDGELSFESLMEQIETVDPILSNDSETSEEVEDIISEINGENPVKKEEPISEVNRVPTEGVIKDIVPESTSSFEQAQYLIEQGYLEDVKFATTEDDEEGVSLSEYKGLTESQLEDIIKAQKESKEKERQEKFIPKENLDEDALKIIEILQNGGKIKDIFETPEESVRPFQGLDIENNNDQARIAFSFYMKRKGLSAAEAKPVIEEIIKAGQLEDFSKKAFNYENSEYDKKLDSKKEEIVLKKQENQKRIKTLRSTLTSTLKEANYKEPISRKVVDSVTKINDKGLLPIQEAFNNLLDKPEENYEKILHLLDDKAFKEVYKIKDYQKNGNKILRILDESKTNKKNQIASNRKEIGDSLFDEIEGIEL